MRWRSETSTAVLFILLTATASAPFYGLIIGNGHVGGGGELYVTGLMWAPAVAAWLTVRIRRLDGKSLGLSWGGTRYAALAYLLPLGYATIAYGLIWLLGFGAFPNPAAIPAIATKLGWSITEPVVFVPLYFLLIATTQFVSSLAHALGEEIGWRGLLTPQLVARCGFTWGAVITGSVWALWHFPLLLFADYNSGTPWWFALPCFCLMVISLSVMMAWLRLHSESVWPCAILHASHNLFIQGFFTPLTAAKGNFTSYAIDEFGVAIPTMTMLFAFLLWTRRQRQPISTDC